MDIGMLWFDGDRKIDLQTRIERAVHYYQDKYGRVPNMCLLHPSTYGDEHLDDLKCIEVQSSTSIRPDHFWLGVEDQAKDYKGELKTAA